MKKYSVNQFKNEFNEILTTARNSNKPIEITFSEDKKDNDDLVVIRKEEYDFLQKAISEIYGQQIAEKSDQLASKKVMSEAEIRAWLEED